MNFGLAFNEVLAGKRARRRSWTLGECIFLVDGSKFEVSRHPLDKVFHLGTQINYHAHVDKAKCGGEVEVYTPSQVDLTASDWIVIEELGSIGNVMRIPVVPTTIHNTDYNLAA